MKGDFSRVRFSAEKQYTRVLQQQGRVALDADANEQCAIDDFLRDTATVDIVGRDGYPAYEKQSFKISVQGQTLSIGPGRYYVDGILCINPEPLAYGQQNFLINPDPTDAALLANLAQGSIPVIQVYLEVWQRLVTALDDSCLREPALGQADTTARLQTVWRVVAPTPQPPSSGLVTRRPFPFTRLSPVATILPRPRQPITANLPSAVFEDCCAAMQGPGKITGSLGKMTAIPGTGGGDCSCQPTPPAGYIGLENQLYRVEIHQGGDETQATFKWSRENASVLVGVTGVSGSQVYVDSVGPDANLGISSGQWVEISDDSFLFGPDPPNQPGNLYQVQLVTPESLTVTMMQNTVAPVNPTLHASMRRWDQFGSAAGPDGISLPVASAFSLENGISVQFARGQYEPGDYWLIPARTATGNIEWPPCDSDGSAFQPPHRIHVYRTPLACIQWDSNTGQPVVHDCRKPFYPLTGLSPSAAPAAIHVSNISWSNDDIMTLDQLLSRPLSGTVAVTTGSPTVTGTGTSFTTELAPGEWLLFAIDEELFQIAAISSDTQLTLAQNYRGDTSQSTTALISGLAVALDQSAPPAGLVTASNFIVTLEVAIPIPVTAGTSVLGLVHALPEPFRTSIAPLFRSTAAAAASHAVPRAEVVGRFPGLQTLASALNAPSVIRFDLQLDGFVNSIGSALTWLPVLSTRADFSTIATINALLSIGAAGGIPSRVRVQLDGRTLFITDSSGALVYLDGQSFGTSGSTRIDGSPRIDLQFPSGNNAKASDFDSWFFLAPILTIVSVTVEPAAVTVTQNAPPPTATGTITLNYPPIADTPVSLSVAPPANVLPVVTVPATVTVPKNSATQTFTVSVPGNTGIPQAQPFVITASMPPALGITRIQTTTINVTGFAVIQ
ncbi:MAG TPA: DUF6519 domain-containing protein [Silvibacterium sp.]|nr:DUF6519 domain-containing protein [Silvibacterium sp.]